MSEDVDCRPDLRLAAALATVIVGAPGAVAAMALQMRHRLPHPVAIHWGLGGEADGFGSLESVLATLAVPSILAAAIGAAAVIGRQPAPLRRVLAGMAAGLPVFLAVLVGDSLRVQLDLAGATAARLPVGGIWAGLALAMAAGVWAARLVTDLDGRARMAHAPPPSSALRLAPHETPRQSWTQRSPTPRTIVPAVVLALGLVTFAAPVTVWPLLVLMALIAVGVAAMSQFTVSVDQRGLTATTARLRLLHVPLEEVAEASVIQVSPFWEFGGWGLRVDAAGRVGLVSRKGEALRIQRGDGSEVIITIDDAAAAAANLNTLADGVERGGAI